MRLHATCFCIKVIPQSVKPETHVVTLPTEVFDSSDDAWGFARNALAEFLLQDAEPEDKLVMLDNDNEEQGYFFSCSDPNSDNHYHIILKYTFF